jgi:hypothetical protein
MLSFSVPPFRKAYALFFAFALLPSCDDAEKAPADPLQSAQVVHCELAEDKACIEYQRVRSGNTEAFVALDEARVVCAAGWNGDGTKPGTFAEGACSTDAALARCRVPRGYLELDYFYEGFADTATREDPLVPLTTLCGKSPGTLEEPPF